MEEAGCNNVDSLNLGSLHHLVLAEAKQKGKIPFLIVKLHALVGSPFTLPRDPSPALISLRQSCI